MKSNSKETKSPSKSSAQVLIESADKAVAKVKQIFTPSQVIGTFCENLPKDQSTEVKSLYNHLLDAFSDESSSKLEIGKTLLTLREKLGENYAKFEADCIISVLRKSLGTLRNYMAMSQAFSLKFAKASQTARTALSRIWSAEGCYDTQNGELKPTVDEAIAASGGLPDSNDSLICETWARKFVDACDRLVKQARKPQVGRAWDAETISKKNAAIVKQFRAFIAHKSVSSKKAIALLAAVLVEARLEMSAQAVTDAMNMATEQIAKRTADIKETAEHAAAA